jgi:molybdate transport system regulatory protein
VIRAFRDVEREIGAALSRLEAGLAARPGLGRLLWSLGLRTSARNALRGVVSAVEDGEVTAKVALDLGEGVKLRASIITRRSREELGLAVGRAGHRPDQVQLRRPGR